MPMPYINDNQSSIKQNLDAIKQHTLCLSLLLSTRTNPGNSAIVFYTSYENISIIPVYQNFKDVYRVHLYNEFCINFGYYKTIIWILGCICV